MHYSLLVQSIIILDLLTTKRTSSESCKNYESRFEEQLTKFNARADL